MLKETKESDLPIFYEHQRDPKSCEVAAFEPRDEAAFFTHWRTKILPVPACLVRTIIHEGTIAGYVSSYASGPERLVAYWIDRALWGRGIAAAALREFVKSVDTHRPLDAMVAASNAGSIRVLEKAGFVLVPDSRSVTGGVEEVRYRLN